MANTRTRARDRNKKTFWVYLFLLNFMRQMQNHGYCNWQQTHSSLWIVTHLVSSPSAHVWPIKPSLTSSDPFLPPSPLPPPPPHCTDQELRAEKATRRRPIYLPGQTSFYFFAFGLEKTFTVQKVSSCVESVLLRSKKKWVDKDFLHCVES